MTGKVTSILETAGYTVAMGIKAVPQGMCTAFNVTGKLGEGVGWCIGKTIGLVYGTGCKVANQFCNLFRAEENKVESKSISEYSAKPVKACKILGAVATGVPGILLTPLVVPFSVLSNMATVYSHSGQVMSELQESGSSSTAKADLLEKPSFLLYDIYKQPTSETNDVDDDYNRLDDSGFINCVPTKTTDSYKVFIGSKECGDHTILVVSYELQGDEKPEINVHFSLNDENECRMDLVVKEKNGIVSQVSIAKDIDQGRKATVNDCMALFANQFKENDSYDVRQVYQMEYPDQESPQDN